VPAHAVTVALWWRRAGRDTAATTVAVQWLVAASAGVVIASPLLVLGWMQRAQIAWLSVNTSSSGPSTLFSLSGSYIVSTAVLSIITVALVLAMDKSKEERRTSWPRPVVDLGVPWMVVPPFILIAVSAVHPVYTSRYILMCVPAVALIVGTVIASFSRAVGSVLVIIVLAAGGLSQLAVRAPAGHFDDIRALDFIVNLRKQPGDAVLYTNPNTESFGAAYSTGLGTLPNVGISKPAIPSGTLAGKPASLAQIQSRLNNYKRVWVVELNTFSDDPFLLGLNGQPIDNGRSIFDGSRFTFTHMWHRHSDYLILFTKT